MHTTLGLTGGSVGAVGGTVGCENAELGKDAKTEDVGTEDGLSPKVCWVSPTQPVNMIINQTSSNSTAAFRLCTELISFILLYFMVA